MTLTFTDWRHALDLVGATVTIDFAEWHPVSKEIDRSTRHGTVAGIVLGYPSTAATGTEEWRDAIPDRDTVTETPNRVTIKFTDGAHLTFVPESSAISIYDSLSRRVWSSNSAHS